MGRMTQQKIRFWNDPDDPVDHDKDPFWINDAAKSALGAFYYYHLRNGKSPHPDHLFITVDRELGTVVVSDY